MVSNSKNIPIAPTVQDDITVTRDYTYLSEVFKYISHYRKAGHQIGRKVGDMLEVVTLAALYTLPEAVKRLALEPKVFGIFGAGHKVEFGLFDLKPDGTRDLEMSALRGFIECKKVGVEQTIDTGHKTRHGDGHREISFGSEITIKLNPRWAKKCIFSVMYQLQNGQALASVYQDGTRISQTPVASGTRLIMGLTVSGVPFFIDDTGSLRDITENIRDCRILEISSVSQKGVSCILNKCLAGPQTPEKAKQASFVALDVRKGLIGQFDKRVNETKCVSILVLTEFSHWEQKSINMIKGSLDYNLVVDDSLIIEVMSAYESAFGLTFLTNITKEEFVNNPATQKIALDIVTARQGRIFRDVADGRYKRLNVALDGTLSVAL